MQATALNNLTTTQLQFIKIQNAWKPITMQATGDTRMVLSDLDSPECKYLSDIAHKASDDMNLGFDQAYEILYDAINSIDIDELQDYDYVENQEYASIEFASVYTHDRLKYLTINNQYDITQILYETGSQDIHEACAVWYDRVCCNILENIFESLDTIII